MNWGYGQLSVSQPPAGVPVTVEEVRQHLHIGAPDDDPVIERLIYAALNILDGPDGIGWAWNTQQWEWVISAFPIGKHLALPGHPVKRLVSVEYLTDDTTFTAFTGGSLITSKVAESPTLLRADSWPTLGSDKPYGIKITYELGGDQVPDELVLALFMIIGQWYENREGVAEGAMTALPYGVQRIIKKYRNKIVRFGG